KKSRFPAAQREHAGAVGGGGGGLCQPPRLGLRGADRNPDLDRDGGVFPDAEGGGGEVLPALRHLAGGGGFGGDVLDAVREWKAGGGGQLGGTGTGSDGNDTIADRGLAGVVRWGGDLRRAGGFLPAPAPLSDPWP